MENYNGVYPPEPSQEPANYDTSYGAVPVQPAAETPGQYGGQGQGAYQESNYAVPEQNAYYSVQEPSLGGNAYGGYSTSQYPGWEYYNNAWHAVPQQNETGLQTPVQPADGPPKKKRGKGAVKAVSLMLACLLCGFGGGYAALSMVGANSTGQQPPVLYKAPENTTNGASGVNNAGDMSVSDIAELAGQSVVSITTENEVMDFYTGGRVVSGAGSGVVISEDGYILTNHHVISGAQNIVVTLPDGTECPGTVVASDARTDVAVIKINATGLKAAVIGDSSSLRVGEFCIAIGNPLGNLGGTVTNGIISALDREITIDGTTMNLLQMSAAVSPGNSGGGLFNSRGELIGIVNAKSGGDDAENLGFAIPIDTAMRVAEDLLSDGYVKGRPGLGVTVQTITSQQEALEAGVNSFGVFIASINPGSAAEQAGLQVGDKVVKANGQDINTSSDLSNLIAEMKIGDALELVVERDGHQMTLTAVLGELTN